GPWLASSHPALWEEVTRMGRKKEKGLSFDLGPLIEKVGLDEVIKQFALEGVIVKIVAKKGLGWLVDRLTPDQREQLKQRLERRPVDRVKAAPHDRRNSARAFRVVSAAVSSGVFPSPPARHSAVCRTSAGSFRFPRCGTGARYGLSVSTITRSAGTSRAT